MGESETSFDIDHVEHSIGGFGGHAFRRLTHVSMAAIPLVYYTRGDDVADYFSIGPNELVSYIFLMILVLEAVRLRFGIVIVGQREYESKQISALAWGAFAVCLTLLITDMEPFSNGTGIESGIYGIPLIFGLTFVDPLMGEIKRQKQDMRLAITTGLAASFVIWVGCSFWLGTPLWICVLLAPLTVLGELPRVKYIDDNATMILFPLAALLLLSPFL